MFATRVAIWKRAPFIRFLVPLMAGIILQWHWQFAVRLAWCALASSLLLLLFSFLISAFGQFRVSSVNGIIIAIIFLAIGSLLTWYKDIRHDPDYFGNSYKAGDLIIGTLQEPLIEKTNSYKALATVTAIGKDKTFTPVHGNIIVYFEKDTLALRLDYGSQIIFSNRLQEIKSPGNPGGFDYRRYCLFQDITHQVFLRPGEFAVLKNKRRIFPEEILVPIRRRVLAILRGFLPGGKEQGLAEALLIGYKDDLDKNLVQSYTNTGVVHIIAISGLHLGLIYWLLVQIFKPVRRKKVFKSLTPLLIISGLWLFSLIAGGQPSVLRSALMFTCIILAESFSRKTSIYNSMALSAFVLLCINPYWLWDVGFQLSYVAVLSIVIFMKPIYNCFFIKNRILDFIWKMNAVSISAQLLTTPFSVFHFHQFPNYFLLTNFVAVPLSSIIVLGELFLCVLSFIPFAATILGKVLTWLIWIMNSYIEKIDSLPYSLWDGMQINTAQAGSLIIVVAGFGYWFLEKQKIGAWIGLFGLLFFTCVRSTSFYEAQQQQQFIIYNVPKHRAIDVIIARHYFFIGDSDLLTDAFTGNFYLKPSRVLHRLQASKFSPPENLLQFGSKRVLLVDQKPLIDNYPARIEIDLLVVSKDPRLSLAKLSEAFSIRQVVFDSSVPRRRIKYWMKDCDSLRIPYYDVNEKGAFVMNLN